MQITAHKKTTDHRAASGNPLNKGPAARLASARHARAVDKAAGLSNPGQRKHGIELQRKHGGAQRAVCPACSVAVADFWPKCGRNRCG